MTAQLKSCRCQIFLKLLPQIYKNYRLWTKLYHNSIGVILVETGVRTPTFLAGRTDPHFISIPSQNFCLISLTFKTKVTPLHNSAAHNKKSNRGITPFVCDSWALVMLMLYKSWEHSEHSAVSRIFILFSSWEKYVPIPVVSYLTVRATVLGRRA